MMRSLVFSFLVFGLSSLSVAYPLAQETNDYLTIKSVTVTEVPDEDFFEPLAPVIMGMEACGEDEDFKRFQAPQDIISGLSETSQIIKEAEVVLDQVVNFGRKLINLVAEGKPVVKTQMEVAHALPKGVKCWSDLSNWSMPQSTSYHVVYTNLYNINVVDFTYRLSYVYGGQKDGQGRYITQATVVPANLDVSWGFTFNAKASIPSVYNMGSKTAPVAGMQVDINWSVDTLLQHREQTDSFGISGLGLIQRLK